MKAGLGTALAQRRSGFLLILAAAVFGLAMLLAASPTSAQTQQQSGAVGVEGRIPTDPPTEAAVITVPANGQSFTSLPVRVAGLCPQGLLVEIFRNNVFAGSVQCDTGSFSIQIDLFDGRNDLVAKVYDALNQAGPDSNTVTVTFTSAGAQSGPRISLTTAYAKRGAAPGSTLSWPVSISGGTPPYAISVDWGDATQTDLISRPVAGDFTLDHIYSQAGTYSVTVKATDSKGEAAFLQLVGVGNGPIQQTSEEDSTGQSVKTVRVILWWPLLVTLLLTAIAFWLGQRHQLEVIRDRLKRGERPFK